MVITQRLAHEIAKLIPDSQKSTDPTVDLLIHLAGAIDAYVRVSQKSFVITQGKMSLMETLLRIFGEALIMRRSVDPSKLDTTRITRLGRVVKG